MVFEALYSPISIIAYFILAIVLIYKFVISEYLDTKKGRAIRVFLWEKVGENLIYDGQRIAFEKKDKKLGVFLLIKKNKIPLQRVSNEDFFQDKKYGKALNLVKYAEDDYRPLVRLNKDYFRIEKKEIMQQVMVGKDENEQPIYEYIPKKDANGNPLYEDIRVNYFEPLGVKQEGRAVMKFNLDYHKRMDEIYGDKKNWLDKYGAIIGISLVAVVLMISFIHMTNKHSETQLKLAATFDEKAEELIKAQENPTFAQNVLNALENRNKEENAPPK